MPNWRATQLRSLQVCGEQSEAIKDHAKFNVWNLGSVENGFPMITMHDSARLDLESTWAYASYPGRTGFIVGISVIELM